MIDNEVTCKKNLHVQMIWGDSTIRKFRIVELQCGVHNKSIVRQAHFSEENSGGKS